MIIWILLVVVVIVLFLVIKNHKTLTYSCVALFTGAPKTGKSWLAVRETRKKYKKQLFKYYWNKFVLRNDIEKPLLYSNIPLRIPHVPIDNDLLLRKKRFRYGSVAYVGEVSLVADSMTYSDMTINEQLQLLLKLFGHETHGGYLILDTQSVSDNHFAIKRCLDRHFMIYDRVMKWLPFFGVLKVRELAYSEDNQSAMNSFNEDIEDSMKWLLVSKRVWKWYDRYCYSCFTDDLEVKEDEVCYSSLDSLKQPYPPTIRKFKTLKLEERRGSDSIEKV